MPRRVFIEAEEFALCGFVSGEERAVFGRAMHERMTGTKRWRNTLGPTQSAREKRVSAERTATRIAADSSVSTWILLLFSMTSLIPPADEFGADREFGFRVLVLLFVLVFPVRGEAEEIGEAKEELL